MESRFKCHWTTFDLFCHFVVLFCTAENCTILSEDHNAFYSRYRIITVFVNKGFTAMRDVVTLCLPSICIYLIKCQNI